MGEKIIKKWLPIDDATAGDFGYSAECKAGGNLHYICVAANDPSESAIGMIVHNSM